MFKFYLSFQINRKTCTWNKSQSLYHFLQGPMWHGPWLFLSGLIYNFPLDLCSSQHGLLAVPRKHWAHSHPKGFSLAGLSIWKVIPLNLCVNCSLTSVRSQRGTTFIILSLTILLHFFSSSQLTFYTSIYLFYYLSPSQDSKKANTYIYHTRDLVKEHTVRTITQSDLKIRVDYMFSTLVKNKPKNFSFNFPDYISLWALFYWPNLLVPKTREMQYFISASLSATFFL